MIDLDGIFNKLLEYWGSGLFPNRTRSWFTDRVETDGVATAAEADLYVTHFLAQGVELAILDEPADWASLSARVSAVSLERATKAGTKIHDAVKELQEYAVARLEAELALAEAELAAIQAKLPLAATFRTWVDNNVPSQNELALEIVDYGVATLERIEDGIELAIVRINERIARIGG